MLKELTIVLRLQHREKHYKTKMSQTAYILQKAGTGVAAAVYLRKGWGLDIKILPHHCSGPPSSCLTLTETGNRDPGGCALTTSSGNRPRGSLVAELLSWKHWRHMKECSGRSEINIVGHKLIYIKRHHSSCTGRAEEAFEKAGEGLAAQLNYQLVSLVPYGPLPRAN